MKGNEANEKFATGEDAAADVAAPAAAADAAFLALRAAYDFAARRARCLQLRQQANIELRIGAVRLRRFGSSARAVQPRLLVVR